MAELPTPDENVHLVLQLFREKNLRPGDGLIPRILFVRPAQLGFNHDDFQSGLRRAEELKLIEPLTNGGYALTEAGFKAM